MYVGLSTLVYGKPIKRYVCQNAWAGLRGPNTRLLKVGFGSLKQSADYNFLLESLILPSSGRLKLICDTRSIRFYLYARAALVDEKRNLKQAELERLKNRGKKA